MGVQSCATGRLCSGKSARPATTTHTTESSHLIDCQSEARHLGGIMKLLAAGDTPRWHEAVNQRCGLRRSLEDSASCIWNRDARPAGSRMASNRSRPRSIGRRIPLARRLSEMLKVTAA